MKKPSFGDADDAINDCDDVRKQAMGANEWQSFDAAEAYAGGNVCFEFLFREERVAGVKGDYYLAILQKRHVWGGEFKRLSVPRLWFDNGVACSGPHRNDQTVFVSDAEPVQEHESICMMPKVSVGQQRVVKSVVWLEKLNKPDRSGAILPEVVESLTLEIGALGKDRKLKLLKRIGFDPEGATNEQIESRAAIVDDVTNDSAPTQWDIFFLLQNYVSEAIRIAMLPKSVRITCNKNIKLGFELIEVFLCPFYLGARSDAWIRVDGNHLLRDSRGWKLL